MKNKAFTLAEVLITLGIIGVVAAMTLPALITSNRNKQMETGLKRSYSLIQQALEMYQAETGERLKADGSLAYLELAPKLKKYFKVVKDCGYAYSTDPENLKGCVPARSDSSTGLYKTFNGKADMNMWFLDDIQYILNDGSILFFENSNASLTRLYISVDVNGFGQRPNRLGQDLFIFQLDKNGKLLPMGVKNSDYYDVNDKYCSVTSSYNMNGAGCTYKAIIEKDYFNKLPK